jgi:hypothetical protein
LKQVARGRRGDQLQRFHYPRLGQVDEGFFSLHAGQDPLHAPACLKRRTLGQGLAQSRNGGIAYFLQLCGGFLANAKGITVQVTDEPGGTPGHLRIGK